MNAPVRFAPKGMDSFHTPLTAVDVFIARCEARAILYRVGEIELQEAVDELQAAAVRTGLVDAIGQNLIQLIMTVAFQEHGQ